MSDMSRRRVGLRESFKIAFDTGDANPRSNDASDAAMVAFALWWWVAGLPESKPDHRDS